MFDTWLRCWLRILLKFQVLTIIGEMRKDRAWWWSLDFSRGHFTRGLSSPRILTRSAESTRPIDFQTRRTRQRKGRRVEEESGWPRGTKNGGTDDASTFGPRRHGGEGQTAPPFWNRYVNRPSGRNGKGGERMRSERWRKEQKGKNLDRQTDERTGEANSLSVKSNISILRKIL